VRVGSGGGKPPRMKLFLLSACHHPRMPKLSRRKSVSSIVLARSSMSFLMHVQIFQMSFLK